MSKENVELVRDAYEGFAAGEFDAVSHLLHPEVEFYGTVGGMTEGQVARGARAVGAAMREDAEAWEERRAEARDLIDVGDRVLVLQHEYRRGRGSGVEVEADTAVIYTFVRGLIVRVEPFMEQAEALAAVEVER